ncbi:MAG: hypothetical protein N2505_00390 [Endomicrobia bacterium]|nr:hypothetical protein [Endomicrobiia bacterium]
MIAVSDKKEVKKVIEEHSKRLNLDPSLNPFVVIERWERQGDERIKKYVLHLSSSAVDELAKRHEISRHIVEIKKYDNIMLIIAEARTKDGRVQTGIGVAELTADVVNAIKKAETVAYRRSTLKLLNLEYYDYDEREENSLDKIKEKAYEISDKYNVELFEIPSNPHKQFIESYAEYLELVEKALEINALKNIVESQLIANMKRQELKDFIAKHIANEAEV